MGTATDLVFGDGDRVVADGRLVHAEDGWWLDSRRVTTLTLLREAWHSERSTLLLDDRGLVERFASTAGHLRWTSVTGVWNRGTIGVEGLDQAPDDHWPRGDAFPPDPPCPAPPGGWRTSGPGEPVPIDVTAAEASGLVVRVQPMRFSGDRLVLVVAATDAAAARAYFEPLLPGRCCVVTSQYARADLDEVDATFRSRCRDWGFEVWSTQNIDLATWQPYADAAMFRVCAELAEWAERLPAGLVRLDPSVRAAPPRRTVSSR